jgi:hypothetical protein
MAITVFASFLLFCRRNIWPKLFLLLGIAILIALPQLLSIRHQSSSTILLQPGYLLSSQLKLIIFLKFWFLNLGLGFFLIPLGVFLSGEKQRKVFYAFFSLFLLGNLFQFTPDIAANHKFFNLFIIVGNMFSAFVLFLLWQGKIWRKIIAFVFFFFLIFSGIIDFFAIKNDILYPLNDLSKNPDVLWIKENTAPQAIFLNSSYLYHPASLAGRKIFLGWPYFPWSAGYDTEKRETERRMLLQAPGFNKKELCGLLKSYKIQFVALDKNKEESDFIPNFTFWQKNFTEVYRNPQTTLTIYNVNKSCDRQ